MRGVETRIQEIRHRIFREAARMAYHTEWPIDKRIEELPYSELIMSAGGLDDNSINAKLGAVRHLKKQI